MTLAATQTPETSFDTCPAPTVKNFTVSDSYFFQVEVDIAEPNSPPCQLLIDVIWFEGLPQPDIIKAQIDGDEASGAQMVTRHFDQLRPLIIAEFKRNLAAEAETCVSPLS